MLPLANTEKVGKLSNNDIKLAEYKCRIGRENARLNESLGR